MPELPFATVEPFLPLPRFDIPREMASEFEGKDVGDRIRATIKFEVVEKTENDVTIEIDSIALRKGRRV